jgi:hypothetical protein
MRPFASALFVVCLTGTSLVTPGCTGRTEEEEVLPWLRILRTESSQVGMFSGPRSRSVEVRYFGFWHEVDADLAQALDADTALLYRSAGPALIHRGDRVGQPICASHSVAHVPPTRKVVDCLDVVEARGLHGAARLGYQRVSGRGAVLARGDISVEDEQSSLMLATLFYDDAAHPYFLVVRERDRGKGQRTTMACSLVTWRDGEATVVGRLPPAADRAGACPDTAAWTKALGVDLHDFDHPQQRPVSTPHGRAAP